MSASTTSGAGEMSRTLPEISSVCERHTACVDRYVVVRYPENHRPIVVSRPREARLAGRPSRLLRPRTVHPAEHGVRLHDRDQLPHRSANRRGQFDPPRTLGGRYPNRASDLRPEHLVLRLEVTDLPPEFARVRHREHPEQAGTPPPTPHAVHQPVENRAHQRHLADNGLRPQSPIPAPTPGRNIWTPLATRSNARFPAPDEGFGGVWATNVVLTSHFQAFAIPEARETVRNRPAQGVPRARVNPTRACLFSGVGGGTRDTGPAGASWGLLAGAWALAGCGESSLVRGGSSNWNAANRPAAACAARASASA